MEPGLVIVAIFVALGIGLALGWLIWRGGAAEVPGLRQAVEAMRGERDTARLDLSAARAAADRLPAIEAALENARHRIAELAEANAGFVRGEEERAASHAAQLAQLKEMEAKVEDRFRHLAGQALTEAQSLLLKRADERFAEQGAKNEGQLRALLSPVEATLKRYEEGLQKVEAARVGSYGELKTAVAQLVAGNEVVRQETQRLTNVLRSSPKARGRWGEEQLRNILESAGLAENVDFSLQSTVSDGEKQLRPDCVINLPGDRCIVVDVKCPLVHFEQAYDEEDEGRRAALLLQHANALKAYANDLGRKAYWRQFDLSPDFVVMFVPGEHFLSAAAERAPELIDGAFRQGVIIASTINMLALAKVMAGMWRQEALAAQAQEVAEVGKELYRRLVTMGNHVHKLGRNLNLAASAYNDFVGSLDSQVMTQARRFEALKVDTGGKAIEALPMVDTAVRVSTKLLPTEASADAAE
ncbi:DNA recombination protein RmuC [Sphingomonas sanxanigenens]|uniref:DNA recombination protein RmuC homolog n=1 Tax=Sphingomonas sanxanigenens DSM 19645 = NX02 TaxID=1123269 RepID=W0ACC5_9SPHN|nr:DNA recombination protein RmuC [Sphingomonas sanxanigenens]AHE53958.1 hypothetical protein NX02_11235 [Sphingomonas sanxanigenens DSM 19645 = NX02]